MRIHLAASSLVGLSTIVGARYHTVSSQGRASQQTRSSTTTTRRTTFGGGSTVEKNEDSTTDSSSVKGPIWKHLKSFLHGGQHDRRLSSHKRETKEDADEPDVGILKRNLGYDDDYYDDDDGIGRDPMSFCADFMVGFGVQAQLDGTVTDCTCYDKQQFSTDTLIRAGRATCTEEGGASVCVKGSCYHTWVIDIDIVPDITLTIHECMHFYSPYEHTACTTVTSDMVYAPIDIMGVPWLKNTWPAVSCTATVDDTVCQGCTVSSADCPATGQVAEIDCTNTILEAVANLCLNETLDEALVKLAEVPTISAPTSDNPVTLSPVTSSPSIVSVPVKTSLPTAMPTIVSEPATFPPETPLPTESTSSLISPSPTQAAVAEKTEEEGASNATPKSSVASAWLVAIGFAASMIVVEWI